MNESEQHRQDAEDKKTDIINQVNREKNNGFEREKEFNDLTKQFEFEKEKEVVFLSDK